MRRLGNDTTVYPYHQGVVDGHQKMVNVETNNTETWHLEPSTSEKMCKSGMIWPSEIILELNGDRTSNEDGTIPYLSGHARSDAFPCTASGHLCDRYFPQEYLRMRVFERWRFYIVGKDRQEKILASSTWSPWYMDCPGPAEHLNSDVITAKAGASSGSESIKSSPMKHTECGVWCMALTQTTLSFKLSRITISWDLECESRMASNVKMWVLLFRVESLNERWRADGRATMARDLIAPMATTSAVHSSRRES